ncbi:hypothetical protein Sango_1276200 [Sesamum angolense]|uniref:Uncharacterized protein n=1 Tax=Sesamum angolense TaxID=2727404 RepID=A0AAE1WRN6_9LAMI|nr:hypothetical protein Sango_1276200 [Sesamum angolense]
MLSDINLRASGGDESQSIGDDGFNNKSSSEYVDNNAINNRELKRKCYNRHTPQQIQNRNTWGEHHKNSNFRTENDELRAENIMYKEALTNACCRACGHAVVARISSNEHHLRVENIRLWKQIDDLAAIVAELVGKPLVDDATIPSFTASPTTAIEVVRRIKGNHKIEE